MSASARATDTQKSGRDQGRVLLVADEAALAAQRGAFERAGLSVVGVAGGVAAIVGVRRTRPHVVVADANLRGVTAAELARSLAQSPERVPLVLVGGGPSTIKARLSAVEAGAFDYFQMPADTALLIARVAQLVEMGLTIDRLRAEADRDYLTGLANRRRFRAAIGRELERWRRYRAPCALLLADIDFLKKINDAHGHSAGDTVIRHVAGVLREHSRDNDTAARLGGEEFALLLAGADEASAVAAAERLRLSVSAAPLEGIGTVTISVGVAACPAQADGERDLYVAADAALYRAKSQGRDRSVLAPPLAQS
ncbi:MAG TPA: diguanylate cyclase [Pyrinomonadaceae bacterium]|nr:diguanylate cyclase [Pyrinomonadaceae bacterium]